MKPVQLETLKKFIHELVRAVGMNRADAEIFADVYMRATLRGVGHHDVYELPERLSAFFGKRRNPNPEIRLTSSFEALESYDGDNGAGEICSAFITERGMKLAARHGIGLCAIKNSNHFLSAAPFVEKAAEAGYLAMIFSRTNPCMGMPGGSRSLIGNCPIGFASGSDDEYPLMLDVCLQYASFGTFKALAAEGKSVPSHWGADANGIPTENPAEITGGGIPYAIGGHKGFGLALLVEILTGVLSGGLVIDEQNPLYEKGVGVYSQTAIIIKTEGLVPEDIYKERVSDMLGRIKARDPETRIPGKSSFDKKTEFESDGSIFLKPELIEKLNEWAERLGVAKI